MRLLLENFLWKTGIFGMDGYKTVLKSWHVPNFVDVIWIKEKK